MPWLMVCMAPPNGDKKSRCIGLIVRKVPPDEDLKLDGPEFPLCL